ncbi:MAG: ATP-binding protein [Flavobacteriales bacterium]
MMYIIDFGCSRTDLNRLIFFAIFMKAKNKEMIDTEIFQAMFTHATEGIIICDTAGTIRSANPSAARLFGFGQGELEGQKVEILIPDNFKGRHQHHRDGYAKDAHARPMGKGLALTGKHKNGHSFPVEISLSPFGHNGQRFIIAFILDITEKAKAEEKLKNHSRELEKTVHDRTLVLQDAINQLERTKTELNESLAQEKELNDMKSRFVSMASHEFRTPLATILSSLSLIAKYTEMGEMQKGEKHIQRIKSSVTNLTDILNDFLSLSKLEEGGITPEPSIFNLKSMVSEICQEMQHITKPGQVITFSYTGNEDVYLDKKITKNIHINLLSNAIKFSDENKPIELLIENKPNKINITIKDHGIGISQEDLEHLFERFHRGRNATNIQGTGLGLNIVKKYVEIMNGKISVLSTLNVGTTFSISIPQPNKLPVS